MGLGSFEFELDDVECSPSEPVALVFVEGVKRLTTSNKVERSRTEGRRLGNVKVLSISDVPCFSTVILRSSLPAEMVTLSDATGGGEEDPPDWDGMRRPIGNFEAGQRSTMNMASRADPGWRTRMSRYSCCIVCVDFMNSMLSTRQRGASGRARMLALQSTMCDR